ncbi:NACHT domain-containing protein [Salinimonas lutimaris]|uniref:hypothetical protein n=1 Tax=Salinimonas lutimaris TaxID=914153 RepID=UPI0010C02D53|nr:hypothetical protein [Salinimonas lutimaris]
MTNTHVAITRRFSPHSEKHHSDSDFSFWGEREAGIRWEDIDSSQCVVVLGEGKCGKTHEFKQQHQLLGANNQFSFFVPLELLQDHDFLDAITAEEELDFERWQDASMDNAVFFLDAVDELKLRQGTLRKALRKIKQTIGSALSRSRFYISCRPNDWNEELDYAALSSLVVQESHPEIETETLCGEKVLTTIISRKGSKERKQTNDNKLSNEPIQVLTLLPFTRHETLEFAKSYAPNKAEAFEHYLEEKELWHLYHLPYEIISALDQLTSEGKLGNLEEQLQFGIKQKVREASDKKRNSLTEDKSIEGSERLALALFLMNRRSIHSGISANKIDVIDIGEILTDWSFEERLELLGKPLFDPTGVNSFRFHHRSTQEYLAAQRLKKLREQGLKTRDLFGLLFSDIKDEKVVIPSMEPITAWMALWYHDIYSEVRVRAPSLMFRQGIPALLPIEYREELICKYVEKFANKSTRCGVGVGHTDLKRVATQELGPTVRELWQQAYSGFDTRELLLELIYLTPMHNCIDLALGAVFDEELPYQHRSYAALSVLEFGSKEQKQTIGEQAIQGEWPERLIRNMISHLIPEAITEIDFLTLAQTLKEVPNNIHGLGYELFKAVKSGLLTVEQRIRFRDSFAQSIWSNREKDCRVYQAHSKYDHFVDAVIYSCLATIPSQPEDYPQWAWCLAVAFHFGEGRNSIIVSSEVKSLQHFLSNETVLREAYYWACLSIVEELEDNKKSIHSDYLIDYNNVLSPFSNNDIDWLMNAFVCNDSKNKKDAAFKKLIKFIMDGENPKLMEAMLEQASDNDEYLSILNNVLNPPQMPPSEYEIKYRKSKLKLEEHEAKRINNWKSWREKVLSSESFHLNDDDFENTLYNLFNMLRQAEGIGTWGAWDSSLIRKVFSIDFLEALRPKLSAFWRTANVPLYTERSEESKNTFSYDSLMALAAVKCCSEKPNWAESLSHAEAVKAVKIATIELNGFADFLFKLEIVHSAAVEEVFICETKAQIDSFRKSGKCPIFHDVLYFGSLLIKNSTIKAIMSKLDTIGILMEKGLVSDLKYAFELVAAHGSEESKVTLGSLLNDYLDTARITIDERNLWVDLLAPLDLFKACEKVMQFTSDTTSVEKSRSAVALFSVVFGDGHRSRQPSFEDIEPISRLAILRDLVIRSYQVVKPSEDNVREGGSYTPNTRDFAEQARNYLLESLSRTHVVGAISVLYELSFLDEFRHLSSRLEQMSVELAARISEPQAMSVSAFIKFDRELSYLPYDDASLFLVLKNRLDDFEHHLLNDEQSIVDTLRKVDGETELRRFITFWLNQNSKGIYTATQEAVVASEKRTDIRLHPSGIDKYASLELKLDDNRRKWSGTELKIALVNQLVGRYLNHERCYVGCLLIAMREPRLWENPETKKPMNLNETVTWLQSVADKIMDDRPELYITVKGIDYSKIANE